MLEAILVVIGGLLEFWAVSIIAFSVYAEDQLRRTKLLIQAVGALFIVTGVILIHYA